MHQPSKDVEQIIFASKHWMMGLIPRELFNSQGND
jgi:hypothetical protein